ncbi:MAG: GIY-YIG nuclease family protein, partial [Anaerolineae bacterium]
PWFLYVLACADSTTYTGITTDVARRLRQHNAGRASRYTAPRRPVRLLGAWQFSGRRAAMMAEERFKGLPRERKRRLCREGLPYREGTFCPEWAPAGGQGSEEEKRNNVLR